MAEPERALAYAREHHRRFVADLARFVSFPSVAAQRERAPSVRDCAQWLAARLREIGFERVRFIATHGQPLVLGEWRRAPSRPTLLVYGHYDVQPAEPLAAWSSPPFRATVRGTALVGRGASDDKGQVLVHLAALESYLKTSGALPVNVVCLFEGEEETGSASLLPLLHDQGRRLGADVALVSDSPMRGRNRPAITYGLRGALAAELTVQGPRRELHSGLFGGAVHNPLQALCELLAALHDRDRRIAVPRFYDRVRVPSADERRFMRVNGPSDAELLAAAGARRGWAERGLSLYEQTTTRPSLTIAGIGGGYTGSGVKSVIPPVAAAKLSLRLVPDQDPGQIEARLRAHLDASTPPTVRSTLRVLSRARPVLLDRRHAALRAAARACERSFGRPPAFLRSGGTIPVVSALVELGLPTVLLGFALPDDGMHAPNEKFDLPTFARAIETSIWFLTELAAAVTRPAGLRAVA